MTPIETKFLLYGCGILLSVLAFIGGLAVNALMKMSNDLHEIKTTIATEMVKREALEKRIEYLETHR
jgi:sensor domain CHASE-containing protein